jgi:hypothetical protein
MPTVAQYFPYATTSNNIQNLLYTLYNGIVTLTQQLYASNVAAIENSFNQSNFSLIENDNTALEAANQTLLNSIRAALATSLPSTLANDTLPAVNSALQQLYTDYNTLFTTLNTDYLVADLTNTTQYAIVNLVKDDQNSLYNILTTIGNTFEQIAYKVLNLNNSVSQFASTVLSEWVNIIQDAATNAEAVTAASNALLLNVEQLSSTWQSYNLTIGITHNNATIVALITEVNSSINILDTTVSLLFTTLENAIQQQAQQRFTILPINEII